VRELVRLAEKRPAFERLGVRLYALAADSREALADLQAELGAAVTLLADPGGVAARRLGLLDPDPFPDRLVARSATLFFDRDGRLAWAAYPESYRARPEPGAVLRAIRRLD